MNSSPFTIYNASAGSGKTYTLVQRYLEVLLRSKNPLVFRHILALTFTNKAVNEMKFRIIDALKTFSEAEILEQHNPMFEGLCVDLGLSPNTLIERSKHILQHILHNYASFDISTIDKFNHRLIRTFAYDLKLPTNFEVELDQDSLLNEAVDSLIQKTGTEDLLTNTLIDFAIEKADEDKSWDISYDFNKIAKRLVNENDLPFINAIKDRSLNDFKDLKTQAAKQIKALETSIENTANTVLTLIDECGLQFDDFSGRYLPKYFLNLSHKKFNVNFEAKWQDDLETRTLYPKRVTEDIAATIDSIQPQLAEAFNNTKTLVFELLLQKNIYKNVTPLSVLSAIQKELEALKEEQNKLLISEFNAIIAEEIKDQPTPYLYERLGEKFKHYFIDEFQDTSQMQWSNLQPLISNALEQEQFGKTGSLMLVGDAKQAIYRWRGGYAEQFINLFNKTEQPFFVEQNVITLDDNYRSYKAIVDFNNSFFKYISENTFSNIAYETLYQNASQNPIIENSGFVSLNFLNIQRDDNRDLIFSEQVYHTIQACVEKGFNYNDICVLVRKKREGLAISDYLSEQQIPIVSSETLLLKNARQVVLINAVLTLLLHPTNNEVKAEVLHFITDHFPVEDFHHFFKSSITQNGYDFFKSFESIGVKLNYDSLHLQPLYGIVESIVKAFALDTTSDAYILSYLDIVFEFSQKPMADIASFLNHFQKKENELSINLPQDQNAVKIMTIHKAKGLEFPVVIFPFSDLDIYREKEAMSWLPVDDELYNGFSHLLINHNKNIQHLGEEASDLYTQHNAELELDNINLLYVVMTRAVEQLFVISKLDINSKGVPKSSTYSGKLIGYLHESDHWDPMQTTYTFGTPEKGAIKEESSSVKTAEIDLISTSKEELNIDFSTNAGLLWDTNLSDAIEKGNLLHDIMAHVVTKKDIDTAIDLFVNQGMIDDKGASQLKKTMERIVAHPMLQSYYSDEYLIYNERDILLKSGKTLRPDRLMIHANTAIILDYKTGLENSKYTEQLYEYADALTTMGFEVKKKILLYINDSITIKEV